MDPPSGREDILHSGESKLNLGNPRFFPALFPPSSFLFPFYSLLCHKTPKAVSSHRSQTSITGWDHSFSQSTQVFPVLCCLKIWDFSAGFPRIPLLHSPLSPNSGSKQKTFPLAPFPCSQLTMELRDKKEAGKGFPQHME